MSNDISQERNKRCLSSILSEGTKCLTKNKYMSEKIRSRIDGTLIDKIVLTDAEISENLGKLSNIFLMQRDLEREKAVALAYRNICREWNLDKDFLLKVANRFESTDESEVFLDILDSRGSLDEAWDDYCDLRDISDVNPFNEDEND